MSVELNLDQLSELTPADYVKALKAKANWKKAQAVLVLADYKLGAKKISLMLPFKKEAEMQKAIKRVKQEKIHLMKKTGGGSFALEQTEEGLKAKIELKKGGLSPEMMQQKLAPVLAKAKMELAVAVAAEALAAASEEVPAAATAAAAVVEAAPAQKHELDISAQAPKEQAVKLLDTFDQLLDRLKNAQSDIFGKLKSREHTEEDTAEVFALKGLCEQFETYYEQAQDAVKAKLDSRYAKLKDYKGKVDKVYEFTRSNPPVRDDQNYKYDEVVADIFKKGWSDTNSVDPNDVQQGYLGDCYFLAAVASLAKTDPGAIKKLIKDNGDGTYDVTLHVYKYWISWNRSPVTVKVKPEFPVDENGNPAYARLGDQELWVMLLEKAYAQYQGSYQDIHGGYVEKAMGLLTGEDGDVYKMKSYSAKEIEEMITEALEDKRMVAADTKGNDDSQQTKLKDGQRVVHGHSYAVMGVSGGKIKLRNPWGYYHLEIDFDTLKEYFYDFSIGDK